MDRLRNLTLFNTFQITVTAKHAGLVLLAESATAQTDTGKKCEYIIWQNTTPEPHQEPPNSACSNG